jgi:hypothetical protein
LKEYGQRGIAMHGSPALLLFGILFVGLLTPSAIAAVPVLNSQNGHYYEEILPANGSEWAEGLAAAESSTFLGLNGHLATITSASENLFITSLLLSNPQARAWVGGLQYDNASSPSDLWSWITGESFVFTNWSRGEPNNDGFAESFGNIENRLLLASPAESETNEFGIRWLDAQDARYQGYVVEYEVPVPATFMLLTASVLLAAWRYRAIGTKGCLGKVFGKIHSELLDNC